MPETTYAFARPPRALVTGAAGGIGLGVVRRLVQHGAFGHVFDCFTSMSGLGAPRTLAIP